MLHKLQTNKIITKNIWKVFKISFINTWNILRKEYLSNILNTWKKYFYNTPFIKYQLKFDKLLFKNLYYLYVN